MSNKIWIFLVVVTFISSPHLAGEKSLKDPTQPPVFATVKPGQKTVKNLKLSSIRINGNDRQVVINGKRLRKGNSIADYRLQGIEVGYVILSNAKGNLRLNLINSRIIRKKL
jgi:hypothetical protein